MLHDKTKVVEYVKVMHCTCCNTAPQLQLFTSSPKNRESVIISTDVCAAIYRQASFVLTDGCSVQVS